MEPSLAERAYQLIKHDIVTCALRPGQQVAQSQLAEEYQIGTTPIRDALQRLAQEKLVQPVPRYGYIITPISLSNIQDMYELRSVLETFSASAAAVRGSQEQLEKIVRLADATYVYRDRESYSKYIALNAEFHCAIAVAGGNQRVIELTSKLLDESTRLFYLITDFKDSTQAMRNDHVRLAQALREREPDRARQIAQEMVAHSHQRASEALTPSLEGGPLGILRQERERIRM